MIASFYDLRAPNVSLTSESAEVAALNSGLPHREYLLNRAEIMKKLNNRSISRDSEEDNLQSRVRELIVSQKSSSASNSDPDTPDPRKAPMPAFKRQPLALLKDSEKTDDSRCTGSSTDTIDDESSKSHCP